MGSTKVRNMAFAALCVIWMAAGARPGGYDGCHADSYISCTQLYVCEGSGQVECKSLCEAYYDSNSPFWTPECDGYITSQDVNPDCFDDGYDCHMGRWCAWDEPIFSPDQVGRVSRH